MSGNTKEGNQASIFIESEIFNYSNKETSWCRVQSTVKNSINIINNIHPIKGDNLPHYENNCENTQICLTSRTVLEATRHSGRYW